MASRSSISGRKRTLPETSEEKVDVARTTEEQRLAAIKWASEVLGVVPGAKKRVKGESEKRRGKKKRRLTTGNISSGEDEDEDEIKEIPRKIVARTKTPESKTSTSQTRNTSRRKTINSTVASNYDEAESFVKAAAPRQTPASKTKATAGGASASRRAESSSSSSTPVLLSSPESTLSSRKGVRKSLDTVPTSRPTSTIARGAAATAGAAGAAGGGLDEPKKRNPTPKIQRPQPFTTSPDVVAAAAVGVSRQTAAASISSGPSGTTSTSRGKGGGRRTINSSVASNYEETEAFVEAAAPQRRVSRGGRQNQGVEPLPLRAAGQVEEEAEESQSEPEPDSPSSIPSPPPTMSPSRYISNLVSKNMPNMPSMPSMPNMPSMPSMPSLSSLTSINDWRLPNMPQMPHISPRVIEFAQRFHPKAVIPGLPEGTVALLGAAAFFLGSSVVLYTALNGCDLFSTPHDNSELSSLMRNFANDMGEAVRATASAATSAARSAAASARAAAASARAGEVPSVSLGAFWEEAEPWKHLWERLTSLRGWGAGLMRIIRHQDMAAAIVIYIGLVVAVAGAVVTLLTMPKKLTFKFPDAPQALTSMIAKGRDMVDAQMGYSSSSGSSSSAAAAAAAAAARSAADTAPSSNATEELAKRGAGRQRAPLPLAPYERQAQNNENDDSPPAPSRPGPFSSAVKERTRKTSNGSNGQPVHGWNRTDDSSPSAVAANAKTGGAVPAVHAASAAAPAGHPVEKKQQPPLQSNMSHSIVEVMEFIEIKLLGSPASILTRIGIFAGAVLLGVSVYYAQIIVPYILVVAAAVVGWYGMNWYLDWQEFRTEQIVVIAKAAKRLLVDQYDGGPHPVDFLYNDLEDIIVEGTWATSFPVRSERSDAGAVDSSPLGWLKNAFSPKKSPARDGDSGGSVSGGAQVPMVVASLNRKVLKRLWPAVKKEVAQDARILSVTCNYGGAVRLTWKYNGGARQSLGGGGVSGRRGSFSPIDPGAQDQTQGQTQFATTGTRIAQSTPSGTKSNGFTGGGAAAAATSGKAKTSFFGRGFFGAAPAAGSVNRTKLARQDSEEASASAEAWLLGMLGRFLWWIVAGIVKIILAGLLLIPKLLWKLIVG